MAIFAAGCSLASLLSSERSRCIGASSMAWSTVASSGSGEDDLLFESWSQGSKAASLPIVCGFQVGNTVVFRMLSDV